MRRSRTLLAVSLTFLLTLVACDLDQSVSSLPEVQEVEAGPGPDPFSLVGAWRNVREDPGDPGKAHTTTYYILEDAPGYLVGFVRETTEGPFWPQLQVSAPVNGSRVGRRAHFDIFRENQGRSPLPLSVLLSDDADFFEVVGQVGVPPVFRRLHFDTSDGYRMNGTWTFLKQDPGLFWAYFTLFINEDEKGYLSGYFRQESHWRNRSDCTRQYWPISGRRIGPHSHISLAGNGSYTNYMTAVVSEDVETLFLFQIWNDLPQKYDRDVVPIVLPLDSTGAPRELCDGLLRPPPPRPGG